MCQYIFYTTMQKKNLIDKLKKLIPKLQAIATIEEDSSEVGAVIKFSLDSYSELNEEQIAHIITDIVQKYIIYRVCDAYLIENKEINKLDKKNIKEAFINKQYLSRQECFSAYTYYLIYIPILNEIKAQKKLNIDGWIRFRTKKYSILIKDLLEQFIMDYSMKKEVLTFIKLMREISSLTAPNHDEVHLVYDENNNIQIYNKFMQDMTKIYIKEYCNDFLMDSTLTREDYLLHILISISPVTITVHANKKIHCGIPFFKTLEIIFEENVIYCEGCHYCKDIDSD